MASVDAVCKSNTVISSYLTASRYNDHMTKLDKIVKCINHQ